MNSLEFSDAGYENFRLEFSSESTRRIFRMSLGVAIGSDGQTHEVGLVGKLVTQPNNTSVLSDTEVINFDSEPIADRETPKGFDSLKDYPPQDFSSFRHVSTKVTWSSQGGYYLEKGESLYVGPKTNYGREVIRIAKVENTPNGSVVTDIDDILIT